MKKSIIPALVTMLIPVMVLASLTEVMQIARQGNTAFGFSVDSDGDFVAVGAPDENGGAVYVFKKNASGELVQLDHINKLADRPSAFGRDVAIKDFGDDGLYLAVGAPDFSQDSPWGTIHQDVVHIFEFNTTTEKFESFHSMYRNDGDGCGTAIDMAAFTEYKFSDLEGLPTIQLVDKGLLLLVGEENYSSGDGEIVLYSYSFETNNWKDVSISDNGEVLNHYGHSIALTDDKVHPLIHCRAKIVVGAPDENLNDIFSNTYSKKGAVYVYELNATHTDGFTIGNEKKLHQYVGLVQSGNTITQESKFGTSVDIANDKSTMIVGALKTEIVSANLQSEAPGAAYIYNLTNSSDRNASLEQPTNPSSKSEEFGAAVSIDSNGVAVVGAPIFKNKNGDTTGAVFNFIRTENGWQPGGLYLGQSENRVGFAVENFGDTILSGDPKAEILTVLKSVSFNPSILMYLLN